MRIVGLIFELLLKKDEIANEFLEDYAIGIHMPSDGFKNKIMNITIYQ